MSELEEEVGGYANGWSETKAQRLFAPLLGRTLESVEFDGIGLALSFSHSEKRYLSLLLIIRAEGVYASLDSWLKPERRTGDDKVPEGEPEIINLWDEPLWLDKES